MHTKLALCPGRGFSNIILPPMPIIGDDKLVTEDFFLPSVIVWNPYLIYPHIIPPGSIKCSHCGLSMYEGYWNDGSSPSRQPRTLHGIDNIVILVSAVYLCDNRHKLLANDELILERFPSSTMIPFILLHRTGFTRGVVDMCMSLCRRGINFYNLESIILERRWESFTRQQELIQIHGTISTQSVSTNDFWSCSMSKSPSNDVLSKCFLAEFLKYEKLYIQEMTAIPTGDSISFDHTFKVAANIGYLREDGKWIHEYDSLFIVLNDHGQVLSWQLTKGTSFSHIKTLLQDLIERPQRRPQTVYVDDCCKLRAKIKAVVGCSVIVKLDLFHAVQRITRTLSKKQAFTQKCMQDLRLAFRCDGDSGESRLMYTPPPDIILTKFKTFIAKWKDVVDENGVKVFKSETFTALKNLERHISAGCLSAIPPGGGTNRNERLHQHIKSFFNRSRVGILLAYALLTMIFQSHNTSTRIGGKLVVRPITASPLQGAPALNIKPIGIMPKHRTHQPTVQSTDHWEMDTSTNTVDYCALVPVYHKSLQKLQIKRSLQKMKLMQMINSINRFEKVTCIDNSNAETDTEFQSTLNDFGLVLSPAAKDGNCFFNALAMNIYANLDSWNHSLTRIGANNLEIASLTMKLRQVFVQEITGEHQVAYENFITTDLDYHEEAIKFLQDGFYASAIGDLMPLAMANVLQAAILIITTNAHSNPMYVTPEAGGIEGTIILVYNPSGSGHYDAAVPHHTTVTVEQDTKSDTHTSAHVCCSCGVNKKNALHICAPSAVYASRCKCYLKCKPCTSSCRCRGCSNPYGTRIPKQHGMTRKRRPHSLQQEIPSSKRFALDRGESLSKGTWSDFETIVIDEICKLSRKQQLDKNITEAYNNIVYYSKSTFCTIPLESTIVFREKTSAQISSKIAYMDRLNIIV